MLNLLRATEESPNPIHLGRILHDEDESDRIETQCAFIHHAERHTIGFDDFGNQFDAAVVPLLNAFLSQVTKHIIAV